jgi:tetratricopeptide (TPR) repeat protein
MEQPDAEARLNEAMKLHSAKRFEEAEAIYRELLERLPRSALVHNLMGVLEGQRKNHRESIRWLKAAIEINERIPDFYDNLGAALLAAGKPEEARKQLEHALEMQPSRDTARTQLARTLMPGDPYPDLIEKLLRWREPKVYIEFGIRNGRTLALCKPPTFAIGVERNPQVSHRFETSTRVYDMTPLDYLDSGRMETVTGRKSFDIALMRAPRRFEDAYDLFTELEGKAAKDAIVIVHGTLPPDPVAGSPGRQSKFWIADQWKLVPCLLEKRPDLTVFSVPAFPVGLTFVTGLKRRTTKLAKNREENIGEFIGRAVPSPEDWKRVFNLGSENWTAIRRRLGHG